MAPGKDFSAPKTWFGRGDVVVEVSQKLLLYYILKLSLVRFAEVAFEFVNY